MKRKQLPPTTAARSRSSAARSAASGDAKAQAATTPLWCPCCGETAQLTELGAGFRFPWVVHCTNTQCGVKTPWAKTPGIALLVWNRRVQRKPAKRSG